MNPRQLPVILLIVTILILTTLACSLGTQTDQQATVVAEQVKATVDALQTTQQATIPVPTSFIPSPSDTPPPTPPPQVLPGSVSGKLSYPSEFIPPQTVIAFQLENGKPNGIWFSTNTQTNDSVYQIDNLPPGKYWVVTYLTPETGSQLPGGAAGYTEATLCGYVYGCAASKLIEVEVKPGEAVSGIDPGDWYAPEGTYPPYPLSP